MSWKRCVINLLLVRLDPSAAALLDWLKPRVDDALLYEIAGADYGNQQQENFQALVPIRDRQEIPTPLPWEPREVLNLTRWSEPDELPRGYHSTGTRGHLARAFSCAVLLRAADELETLQYTDAENATLIQLIASVLHLGHEATESASRFLCWRILRMPLTYEDYPFFALGLLLLRAALFVPPPAGSDLHAGADLEALAAWVVREETRARRDPIFLPASDRWLLGLTFFDLRHTVWTSVAQAILRDPSKGFPRRAALAMNDIAKRLVQD